MINYMVKQEDCQDLLKVDLWQLKKEGYRLQVVYEHDIDELIKSNSNYYQEPRYAIIQKQKVKDE